MLDAGACYDAGLDTVLLKAQTKSGFILRCISLDQDFI